MKKRIKIKSNMMTTIRANILKVVKEMFKNDTSGWNYIARGINKGLGNKEVIRRAIIRKMRRHNQELIDLGLSIGFDVSVLLKKSIKEDEGESTKTDTKIDSHQVQVIEKEIVRDILNQHLFNFLNEVITTGDYVAFKNLSDYNSGEKDFINHIWNNEIAKKKKRTLLGKAQQLKDIIETFQIRVHDLSFKFLLYITSK